VKFVWIIVILGGKLRSQACTVALSVFQGIQHLGSCVSGNVLPGIWSRIVSTFYVDTRKSWQLLFQLEASPGSPALWQGI
jgi:hypothetical protein